MKKLILSLSTLTLITISSFAQAKSLAPNAWQIVSNAKTDAQPVILAVKQIKNLVAECKGEVYFYENEVETDKYFVDYSIGVSCNMDDDKEGVFPSSIAIEAQFGKTRATGEFYLRGFESSFNQAVPSGVSVGTK